ncbi:hypothetical protein PR048_024881 [Dryococelus australis]|uniref:Uncharacterized protein n=1 Tax=Dryococelus australis TaxID=614101 RepID=A0ABQ9GPV9_9NEOP|nr:hypothetical protein PR048_024881 [Dryococelus australis]
MASSPDSDANKYVIIHRPTWRACHAYQYGGRLRTPMPNTCTKRNFAALLLIGFYMLPIAATFRNIVFKPVFHGRGPNYRMSNPPRAREQQVDVGYGACRVTQVGRSCATRRPCCAGSCPPETAARGQSNRGSTPRSCTSCPGYRRPSPEPLPPCRRPRLPSRRLELISSTDRRILRTPAAGRPCFPMTDICIAMANVQKSPSSQVYKSSQFTQNRLNLEKRYKSDYRVDRVNNEVLSNSKRTSLKYTIDITIGNQTGFHRERARLSSWDPRMEWHCNARAGETGVPRESPPASGIAQHDSHMRRSGSEPAGDRTRTTIVGGERPHHCPTIILKQNTNTRVVVRPYSITSYNGFQLEVLFTLATFHLVLTAAEITDERSFAY